MKYFFLFAGALGGLAFVLLALRNFFTAQISLRFLAALGSVACGLFFTAVNYPGVLSMDSISVWTEAVRNVYTGSHPPILGLVSRVFYLSVGNRIEWVTLAQAVTLYASVFFLVATLCRQERKSTSLAYLFILLSTPLWIYSVTLWKDTFLAIQFCFLCAFLLRYFQRYRVADLLVSTLFLAITIAARHNAILLIFPFAAFLFYDIWSRRLWQRGQRRLVMGMLGLLALGLLIPQGIVRATHAKPGNFRNLVLLTTYLSWAATHERRGLPPDPEAFRFWNEAHGREDAYQRLVARDVKCGDEWNYMLDPSIDRTGEAAAVERSPGHVNGLMLRFLIRNPMTVVHYVICNHARLLDLKDSSQYWYHGGVEANDLGIAESPASGTLLAYYRLVLRKSFEFGISKHGLYLLLLLAMLVTWLMAQRKKSWADFVGHHVPVPSSLFILPGIGLSYYGTFIIVPAVSDWRYLMPIATLAHVWLAATLANELLRRRSMAPTT